MAFAEGTKVPVQRSRDELQRVLERFGVKEFAVATDGTRTRVGFRARGLLCAIEVPALDRGFVAKRLNRHPAYVGDDRMAAEDRRRWRALVMVVKAKLEAVATWISTVEGEFMANVVLKSGRLLADELRPRLRELAESPDGPRLLPDVAGLS